MEFGLSEEQRLLDESLRGFLADRLPLDALRRIATSGAGFDAALLQGLTEQGLPGLLVPERFGGSGLGLLDAAVAAEAMGHAAVPSPFLAACVMAPLAVMAHGDQRQQAAWLPLIAAGEARIAVAAAAVAPTTEAAQLHMEGDRLFGNLEGALDTPSATHALVYLPGGRPVLVAQDDKGVKVESRRSLDRTRPLAMLGFYGAAAEPLDAANDPLAAASRVIDAGRTILAADTLGAAQCMFDRALDWAKERVQFGRTIGSFQAVKHQLADMATMLEPCRAFVWYAAHAQDAAPEEARLTACHAKAHLAEVGREVARLATEVHGGMGFTDLLGLHYWFKRIAWNRQVLGSPERCRQDAAIAQGWLPETTVSAAGSMRYAATPLIASSSSLA